MKQHFRVYSGRIAATVCLSFALYLCALCAYVMLGASHRLHNLLGEVRVSVELSQSATKDTYALEKEVVALGGIKSVRYIAAKEAQQKFSDFLGHDITENIQRGLLPDVLMLTLSSGAIQGDGMERMRDTLQAQPWAESVHFESSIPEKVNENIERIEWFSQWVSLIVALCALIVAYLVIRLSVGATFNCYPMEARYLLKRETIRWAWISGVISGVCAALLLTFTLLIAKDSIHQMVFSLDLVPQIGAGAVVISVVLSLLFSSISIAMQKNIINR